MKQILFTILAVGVMAFGSINAMASDAPAEGEGAENAVHFVNMEPLILPVMSDHGGMSTVSLVVAVEVNSLEKVDQVKAMKPRLNDAYLTDLYGAFAHQVPENGIVPIPYLKKRLNLMSAKVLGKDVVDDVLIQVMQSRKS